MSGGDAGEAGGAWRTAEQVAADVARAAGGRAPAAAPAPRHLLRGDRPPPRCTDYDEDEESEGMCGAGGAAGRPDLPGIRDMLRMYEEYGDRSGGGAGGAERAPARGELLVLSKLDPRVPVFVPRHATALVPPAPPAPPAAAGSPQLGSGKSQAAGDSRCPSACAPPPAAPLGGGAGDRARQTEAERERRECAALLRTKICSEEDVRPTDLVRLMRLFAGAPATRLAPHASLTPRLCTPDYFRTCPAPPAPAAPPASAPHPPRLTDARLEPRNIECDEKTAEAPLGDVDKIDYEASINKVINWMASKPCVPTAPAPPAPPAPPAALHLGSFTYKRKESKGSTSPSGSGKVAKGAAAVGAGGGGEYVPSAYAAELSRKYAAAALAAPAPAPAAEPRPRGATVWDSVAGPLRARATAPPPPTPRTAHIQRET